MRKVFIIIVFLSFLNCEKFSLSYKEKFFDPKDLPRLSLEHIGNFWDTDSLNYGSNPFVSCSTYLAGVELRGNEKRIDVAVFKSQADAINSMEGRINTAANVIKPGMSNDILKGNWWFGDGIPNAVFVNQGIPL